jgi:hypothetical protein
MDARIAAFLTRFAGVPEGDLHAVIDLGEVLDRHGYFTEPDWCTYERADLIQKWGQKAPVWKLAGILLNAGGTFNEGALDYPAFHLIAERAHDFACKRKVDALLDAAFSEQNPHMAEYVRRASEVH